MAYSRRQVTDGTTIMNAELYDNLQDGIDECLDKVGSADITEEQIEDIVNDLDINYDGEEGNIDGVTKLQQAIDKVNENTVMLESAVGYTKKNLIPYPYYKSTPLEDSGLMWSGDNGVLTGNGTATNDCWFNLIHATDRPLLLKKGDYILNGCAIGGSSETYRIELLNSNFDVLFTDIGNGCEFTLEEDTYIGLRIFVFSDTTLDNLVFKPMIRLASIKDDTYEQYQGEDLQSQVAMLQRTIGYTKSYNLLPFNKVAGTWNGITTTPVLNDDNSLAYYSVSGSRTSETYYNIYDSKNLSTVFPKGIEGGKTYKVSANSTNALIKIGIYEMINGAYRLTVITNTEAEWTPNANTTRIEVRISVDSNASGLNDVRIYPMIRPNDIEDSTYMPYVEDVQSRLLTIKQKTMTVTTDANGNALLNLPISTHVINITSNSFLTSDMVGFIPCVANASWYVRLVKNYGSYAPKGNVTATITVTYLE